jgi:thymidylate synthase (FAD)
MKIINAGYEFINDNSILKKIELAGRVCYKSEDKISEDSAKTFVSNIIKRGHEAVLEHGSFCFEVDEDVFDDILDSECFLEHRVGFTSFLRHTNVNSYLISGNVRAWRDFLKAHLKYIETVPGYMKEFLLSNPILFPEFQNEGKFNILRGMFRLIDTSQLTNPIEICIHHDITVKFTVDRGVSHEIVRHRPSSYCQESTRYCNYSKDKFGNEITVIKPCFWDETSDLLRDWKSAMKMAESHYFDLLEQGATPQEARSVLPNSLKTEVVMTANIREWRHFFKLRTSPAAHPQIREVAIPLLKDCQAKIPVLFDDIEVE